MTRAAWRKALGSPGVGAQLPRPVRATLFVLAEAMTADGRLSVAEEILTNRAQVSWRTLARHRREAAEAGWLLQSQRGCLGRIACYQAALPTEMGANPGSQQDRDGCQPPRPISGPNGCHWLARSEEHSASGSEPVALSATDGTALTHAGESVGSSVAPRGACDDGPGVRGREPLRSAPASHPDVDSNPASRGGRAPAADGSSRPAPTGSVFTRSVAEVEGDWAPPIKPGTAGVSYSIDPQAAFDVSWAAGL